MALLFWVSAACLSQTFIAYPLSLLLFDALRRPRPPKAPHRCTPAPTPTVTMVVAAHDEAGCIAAKIANFQALDYPAGRLELIVGSDGSTDATEALVERAALADARIRLSRGARAGKASVLNRCIPMARGDWILLSDANTMIAPDALKQLSRHFSDDALGAVAGQITLVPSGTCILNRERLGAPPRKIPKRPTPFERRLDAESFPPGGDAAPLPESECFARDTSAANDAERQPRRTENKRPPWTFSSANHRAAISAGALHVSVPDPGAPAEEHEGLYWRYETWLKRTEGRLGILLGANGGLYAFRRALFAPLPPEVIVDDLVLPLRLLLRGFRLAYEPEAGAIEETAGGDENEAGRRARIAAGNFQSLRWLHPLLSPRWGRVAYAFWSHKILRWTAPLFLGLLFASNLLLLGAGPLWSVTLAGQIAFYGLAFLGSRRAAARLPLLRKPARVAHYFVRMNWAQVEGFLRFVKGSQSAAWDRTART